MRRQLPRWGDIRPLLNPRLPDRSPTRRRLARAHDIGDLRLIARRRTPRSVFDYVDGAADAEAGLGAARAAFAAAQLRPRVLRDVAQVDPSATIMGRRAELPIVLAPTGFTRMMNAHGETAVARAAERAGVPYALSTMGTTSVEDVAAAAPDGRHWFQLYLWRDRDAGAELIARAEASGYDTLVLTVDTPVAGARLRDARNGMTIPPTIGLRTMADMATHPAWWMNVFTTPPLEFASLRSWNGTVAELVAKLFDASVTVADLAWLREAWRGKLVVKGIQHVDDAKAVVDAGADGIVVSSHGGRQLDRTAAPLLVLPEIVAAVGGRAEVMLDSGVLNGADAVCAVAQGASAVMVGRAYLYGLMAGGEQGVDKALSILRSEIVRTMALLGAPSLDDLTPDHVRLVTP